MGCDIHLFIEARDAGGSWLLATVTSRCSWCDGDGRLGENDCYACNGSGLEVGYSVRDYSAFAILAGVRNGRSAGDDMGDGFVPIAEPRGLPNDIGSELRAAWIGDHSHSYLYLRELLEFNWNQRTNLRGVVSPTEFSVFMQEGAPDSYCGSCSGPHVYTISNAVMAMYVERSTFKPDHGPYDAGSGIKHTEYDDSLCLALKMAGVPLVNDKLTEDTLLITNVQWSQSYKESVPHLHQIFIPALAEFARVNGYSKDDVRIVFGFDS